MRTDETPVEAMYRELREETGLLPEHVSLSASTPGWLRYNLPRQYQRTNSHPVCIGQKQRWFLLLLRGSEDAVRLDAHEKPEFDHWKWVHYWRPHREVIFFKRNVYRQALEELAPLLGLRKQRRESRSGQAAQRDRPHPFRLQRQSRTAVEIIG